MSRRQKQKAGGAFDSFCIACGKPMYDISRIVAHSEFTDMDDPGYIDISWLTDTIGYEPRHDIFIRLGADDHYGTCPVNDKQSAKTLEVLDRLESEGVDISEFHIESPSSEYEEDQLGGYVMHKDCAEVIRQNYGYLKPNLVLALGEQPCKNEFQGQDFDIEEAIATYGEEYFETPLHSEANRNAVLQCVARADAPRRLALREAATAERALRSKLPPNVTGRIKNLLRNKGNVYAGNVIRNERRRTRKARRLRKQTRKN